MLFFLSLPKLFFSSMHKNMEKILHSLSNCVKQYVQSVLQSKHLFVSIWVAQSRINLVSNIIALDVIANVEFSWDL